MIIKRLQTLFFICSRFLRCLTFFFKFLCERLLHLWLQYIACTATRELRLKMEQVVRRNSPVIQDSAIRNTTTLPAATLANRSETSIHPVCLYFHPVCLSVCLSVSSFFIITQFIKVKGCQLLLMETHLRQTGTRFTYPAGMEG